MNILLSFKGELAGLSAAFLWAVASLYYQQLSIKIKPIFLNLVKGIIASLLLFLVIALIDQWPEIESDKYLMMLAVSGVIGIAIGDTFFFMALKNIGARKMLLLETLSPPFAAIIGIFVFAIYLSLIQWFAIFIILLGIYWVTSEKAEKDNIRTKNIGFVYGILAALCQATGAVLAHVAMNETNFDALFSAFIRITVATGLLLPWLYFIKSYKKELLTFKFVKLLFPAIFIGTFLCIWLQQISFHYTSPAIAQALLALSPVIILPILKLRGELISRRAIFGALISVTGVTLLFIETLII